MKRYILLLFIIFGISMLYGQERDIPQLPTPTKKEVQPKILDTLFIRPDVEYTFTSNKYSDKFDNRLFTPVSLTYWEFEEQLPFYVKVGLGYPLLSVCDVYATTHRADVGYLMGYFNHEGRYSKIDYQPLGGGATTNDNKSQKMLNRVGVAGGKYLGKYTFEGDLYYQSNIFNRFPLQKELFTNQATEVNFEDITLNMRLGDSFADLSHLNFEVYFSGNYFNDKSQFLTPKVDFQQAYLSAGGRIGRNIGGKSSFWCGIDYKGYLGVKDLSENSNHRISANFIYGYNSGTTTLKFGLKYNYDCLHCPDKSVSEKRHIVAPYLYASFNIKDGAFVPYIELDSRLDNNNYYSLLQTNPYFTDIKGHITATDLPFGLPSLLSIPNTLTTSLRFGFGGKSTNSILSYSLFADISYSKQAIKMFNVNRLYFSATTDEQAIYSINGKIDFKPLSCLLFSLTGKGNLFRRGDFPIENNQPKAEAQFNFSYTHRKFAIGLSAHLIGKTPWSVLECNMDDNSSIATSFYTFYAPTIVDLNLNLDIFVTKHCTIFFDGQNLTNQRRYAYAFYREYGATAIVGAKFQF